MFLLQENCCKIYLSRLFVFGTELGNKMANVLITLKIMPENIDVDLNIIENQAKEKIKSFGGDFVKSEQEPVAFGLKALKIIFFLDENKGSTDSLEEDIKNIELVQSVDVIDVRRAVG